MANVMERAVAQMADELDRIEDLYGPGEDALALIGLAVDRYGPEVSLAAMRLRGERERAGVR